MSTLDLLTFWLQSILEQESDTVEGSSPILRWSESLFWNEAI